MADRRPDVYWEGESLIIRASSFGRCIGALVRCGMGMTPESPPQALRERWAQGVVGEPEILKVVSRRGWRMLGPHDKNMSEMVWGEDGQPELELRVGKVVIRCHPDAITRCYIGRAETGGAVVDHDDIVHIPEWNKMGVVRVVEAKLLRPSMDHHTFRPYQWQMSTEMACTGLPGMWAIGRKDDDGLLVPGLEGVALEPVDVPPYTTVEIKKRALAIYRAIRAGELVDCDARDFPCGYWTDGETACSKKARELGEPLPEALRDTARRWTKAKQWYEDAKKELEKAREEIIGGIGGLGGDRYAGEGVGVVRTPGRKKLRKDKIEKELGRKLGDEDYVVGAEYWTLNAVEE